MKKTIICALCMAVALTSAAQTQKQKVNVSNVKVEGMTKAENFAELKLDTLRRNFGTSREADHGVRC